MQPTVSIKPVLPLALGDPRKLITNTTPVRNSDAARAALGASATTIIGLTFQIAKGRLSRLALATATHILVLVLEPQISKRDRTSLQTWFDSLSSSPACLVAYDMGPLSLHVWRDLGCRIGGLDLATVRVHTSHRDDRPSNLLDVLSTTSEISSIAFDNMWESADVAVISQRAWISMIVGERLNCRPSLHAGRPATRIETASLPTLVLDCLSKMALEIHQLEATKPRLRKNDFSGVKTVGKANNLEIMNERYSNHVRASQQTTVVLTNDKGQRIHGKALQAKGKRTSVKVNQAGFQGEIKSIHVVGKEELTSAEKARNAYIVAILAGQQELDHAHLNRLFFFSTSNPTPPSRLVGGLAFEYRTAFPELNESQAIAAGAIVSGDQPVVIVQGPPGTGKTSTISAAVEELLAVDGLATVWIVAGSNVGVKNIAESLARREVDFKLVVSMDFKFEWHDHLYESISRMTISSEKLPTTGKAGVERLLVQRLIIDEASQISIYEYMHIFHKFNDDLRQVAFFGDNKQLPPYGIEAAPTIRSVFELPQFQQDVYFLNTQYRMPVPLGNFISKAVYDSRLLSQHAEWDPRCITFVDVAQGKEEKPDGRSWINQKEVQTVVNLVKNYYHSKIPKGKFCVITPYDAQRAAIEKALKGADLPWEDVYNVDSFQGNEAPYVIVSVVRTRRPGFLESRERVNVMLTRCKQGMVIVSNKKFLAGPEAQSTLLGEMASLWTRLIPKQAWTTFSAVSLGNASIPGFVPPIARRRGQATK